MLKKTLILTGALGVAAIAFATTTERVQLVEAADHIDGPDVTLNKPGDLTDLYAWMIDDAGTPTVALVLSVDPLAQPADAFPTNVHYVFNIARGTNETKVICQFESNDNTAIRCWVGDAIEHVIVSGDPTDAATPLANQGVKVFAGLRQDPFSFNFLAFGKVQSFVKDNLAAVATLADPLFPGCFDLSADGAGFDITTPTFSSAFVACLTSSCDADIGQPHAPANAATDFFASLDVLGLTVTVPLTMVAGTEPSIKVYASTHAR